jgi:hypothetical protein
MGLDYVSELQSPTVILQMMYEYGATAEICWQGKNQRTQKILSQCQFVHDRLVTNSLSPNFDVSIGRAAREACSAWMGSQAPGAV